MNRTGAKIAMIAELLLGLPLTLLPSTPRALTFEDRVKAQEAIERVYYDHRIWPKENPGVKPLFEQVMSRDQLEAKVREYLLRCDALGKFWQRPIESPQLQAEMDRMAKGTRDAAMLKELYAALDNDPYLVAECLARPLLADRLIHNWYSSDTRFHAETRENAERALKEADPENLASWPEGQYQKVTYRLKTDQEPQEESLSPRDEFYLEKEELQKERAKAPEAGRTALRETVEEFVVERTVQASEDELVLETLAFAKHPFGAWWEEEARALPASEPHVSEASFLLPAPATAPAPEAAADSWAYSSLSFPGVPDGRYLHTAIWTGTEMIVWGGWTGLYLNTGGRYSPTTDTWTATSTGSNCPSVRSNHTAVWTGTEMIIWGGLGPANLNTGARYAPSSDSWTPTATGGNSPSARAYHSAVWTGSEMIIWGGNSGTNYYDTGGRYSPTGNTWTVTPTGGNCPSTRAYHTAVWTGSEMIVWGGYNGTIYFDTGGRYSPAGNTWIATKTGTGCPVGRSRHAAFWTGTEMIVWGGIPITNTGGRYNPSGDCWASTSTGSGCPSVRVSFTASWTGTEMIIWGGYSGPWFLNTGGRYNPISDSWTATSTGTNCPSAREYSTAVWTGTEMILWGGHSVAGGLETGGRFNPSTNAWLATSVGTNCPAGRMYHTAVWTGTEMIVWGGYYPITNTGGRYFSSTDTWSATPIGIGCPTAREYHTALWTGNFMIIWGGYNGSAYLNTGGKYDPAGDSWAATGTGTDYPTGRGRHTAVWTGTEMIVWGGYNGTAYTNTGGRYTPGGDSWTATSTVNCPTARGYHSAVWTGTDMIVWGGYDGATYFDTGGSYTPSGDSWAATPTGANCPAGRYLHTAVWTDSEMIIWGGYNGSTNFNTGGRLALSKGTWSATSTSATCPLARREHTAVWTGTEMIVWGGYRNTGSNTGGRYDPSGDSWTATSTGANCPTVRYSHTAVLAGPEMIVWGGLGAPYLNNGGRYVPGGCTDPSAPVIGTITDDDACAQNGITITFTAGAGASAHHLLMDNAVVATGISSPCPFNPHDTRSHNYSVRAANACSTTDSAPQTFADGFPAPGAPGAADADPFALSGVNITWGGVPGATGYDLNVDSGTLVADVTSPYLYTPGNSASHTYQVRSKTATCTGSWSIGTAGADLNYWPAQVTGPNSPSDGETICSLSPTLTWNAASGATTYTVLMEGSPVSGCQDISGTSCALAGLSNTTTYHWLVKSSNIFGTTDGPTWSFATNSGPIPLDLKNHLRQGPNGTSVHLDWSLMGTPAPTTTHFHVYRAASPSAPFPAGWTLISEPPISQMTFDDEVLNDGVAYCYDVRSADGCNNICPSILSATATSDSPSCGGTGLVHFTAQGRGGTSPYTYDWDFGDGSPHGSGASASHTYSYPPYTYAVTMTVTDNTPLGGGLTGQQAVANLSAKVGPGTLAGAPTQDGPKPVGVEVEFASNPSGGVLPYTYLWDFGDGSPQETDQNPSHAYATSGTKSVTITVTDGIGCSVTTPLTVVVQ